MSQNTITTSWIEEKQQVFGETPAENTVKVKIYGSFDQLESIRFKWDEFVEATGCDIYLTYDWCRLWWKYYGDNRQLRVFVFRHQEALVGIVPVFFEKIWIGPVFLRTVKIVGTDFTISTVTLPIQKEFMRLVVRKFLAELVTNYHWDALHIGPLSGISDDVDRLFGLCAEYIGKDYHIKKVNKDVQTYFMLTDNWPEQLNRLSKKQNRIIRQKYNALRKALGDGDITVVSNLATIRDYHQIFNKFAQLHRKHWKRMNLAGHFGDWPDSRQFHFEVARQQLKYGRLRLFEFKAGSHILGYKYSYKFGDKYVEFLDARSGAKEFARAGLGNIIFCEQMKKAIEEGVRYIDSLGGKYEHKLRMGGELLAINNIYIYSAKISSSIRRRIFIALARLLHLCYYRIWFSKISPKFAFKPRVLWKTWIRSHMFTQ